MQNELKNYQRIAIAVHPKNIQAYTLGEEIAAYLENDGKQVILGKMDETKLQENLCDGCQDMLIALGGDGTMLRAGHICAPSEVPILGINLGRYGFLTEIQRDEWQKALKRVFHGEYWLEERMMLLAELFRGEKSIGKWTALNEAVLSRGETI